MNKKILKTMENVGSLFFFAAFVVMLLQIITRYVFNASPAWTDELSRYSNIWSTMLFCIVLSSEEGHIYLDYFIEKINKRYKYIVIIILNIIMLVLSCTLLIGGIGMIYNSIGISQLSPGLEIPMWYVYIVIPIAGFCMIIIYLIKIIYGLKSIGKKSLE
jgi:TRAP-type C4-dicarboxylate transport system permease small subunit